MIFRFLFIFLVISVSFSCENTGDDNQPTLDTLILKNIRIGTTTLQIDAVTETTNIDGPIILEFDQPVDLTSVSDNIKIEAENGTQIPYAVNALDQNQTLSLALNMALSNDTNYSINITDQLTSVEGHQPTATTIRFKTSKLPLILIDAVVDNQSLINTTRPQEIDLNFDIQLTFSEAVKKDDLQSAISFFGPNGLTGFIVEENDPSTFILKPQEPGIGLGQYRLVISASLVALSDNEFDGFNKVFYTQIDPTPKFPIISTDELLTKIQEQTFKYFWDFGHPVSGMARERNRSGETVTSGGSGFGLMAMIVGVERNFITRNEAIDRWNKIVDFLEKADRFHGVWSHWINGTTGKVIPFSPNDNGGDLVETSFLCMGLITVREYLDDTVPEEKQLIDKINTLWQEVEWNWHTQGGQNVLFWHWSPNFGWEKNLRISGYNESLITYIMSAASPTFPIEPEVYHQGWARNGDMKNGRSFYDIELPLGSAFGGPLFFSHYTFLGIDPRNLSDQYANYMDQGIAHSMINHQHCIVNPSNFVGYSDSCWGLTASDGNNGYSAHSPTRDVGVITPTAAISSIPYTPDESLRAIEHFYYILGDRLWGEYGFYDAFNLTENWIASSYLAIDQGPIIGMIENHRTGLLWDLFMNAPEVQNGLTRLDFQY